MPPRIPQAQEPPQLSLVVPVYNEADAVGPFCETVLPLLAECDVTYEVIFVNDGSGDNTLSCLKSLQAAYPGIRVLDLTRNFGKDHALMAGLDHCHGQAVVPMDVDLQDPPSLLPRMLEQWRAGAEVVLARRSSRAVDSWAKRVSSRWFYDLYNRVADVPIPADVGDFRLMDRRVVEAVKELREHNRFMKGVFAWVGFRTVVVEYERPARARGQSKWNYWKLWNFAIDGITGFSSLPLKVWSYAGLAVSTLSFCYAGFLVARTLLLGVDVPGYASIMVVILFLGGVQLVSLGVIGEYLSRIYQEAKQRPLYLLREELRAPGTPPPEAGDNRHD